MHDALTGTLLADCLHPSGDFMSCNQPDNLRGLRGVAHAHQSSALELLAAIQGVSILEQAYIVCSTGSSQSDKQQKPRSSGKTRKPSRTGSKQLLGCWGHQELE